MSTAMLNKKFRVLVFRIPYSNWTIETYFGADKEEVERQLKQDKSIYKYMV